MHACRRHDVSIAAAPLPSASPAAQLSCAQIWMEPSPWCPQLAMKGRSGAVEASTDNTTSQWPVPGASAAGRPRSTPTICVSGHEVGAERLVNKRTVSEQNERDVWQPGSQAHVDQCRGQPGAHVPADALPTSLEDRPHR